MSGGARVTRGRALEAAALAVGWLAVGGVVLAQLPDPADSRPSAKQDATILNFALLLEYVQGGLYDAALRGAGLEGELRHYAQVVSAHERAHAALLRGALASAARRAPKLDFGEDARDAKRFVAAAVKVEDLGVEALNAQGPTSRPARSRRRRGSCPSRRATPHGSARSPARCRRPTRPSRRRARSAWRAP